MASRPKAEFRLAEAMVLTGILAVYETQAEASAKIPEQWQRFLSLPLPEIKEAETVYGASPCTGDHKIHYLCGVAGTARMPEADFQELALPAGEYAIFTVDEHALRGDTWGWIFDEWIPASGYRERSAPEFERFPKTKGAHTLGTPVELGVPIEQRPTSQQKQKG